MGRDDGIPGGTLLKLKPWASDLTGLNIGEDGNIYDPTGTYKAGTFIDAMGRPHSLRGPLLFSFGLGFVAGMIFLFIMSGGTGL
jgi:hypothetical protein